VWQARLEQAQADKRVRETKGTMDAETELAQRESHLADVQATLTLLEAGPRAEEVEAERARVARLQQEALYLEQLQEKLRICSPVSGLLTTPRLRDKVGQYLQEGELICAVEEPARLEVEITLAEQDMAMVHEGQAIALRTRMSSFATLSSQVDRVAPVAVRADVQSSVTAYCRLDGSPSELRSGMTGHARVYTGRRPVGTIVLNRAIRLLRTEFWW
jgi:putative peptide zinc metalloprotease protein